MTETLQLGQLYTRSEIYDLLGGSQESYLPMRGGAVVCGCFNPRLNLRAPREIDIGSGPVVVSSAEALVASGAVIPVFLKEATSRWRFVGRYRATSLSFRPEDVGTHSDRRPDAVAVLFLEEAAEPEPGILAPDPDLLEAVEGRAVLRIHLARERKPSLVATKKRLVLAAEGALVCEVCGLRSSELPADVADACFEGHHLVPLADLAQEVVTRLDDLALVCANCHRMIHRSKAMATVAQLRRSLNRPRGDA